MSGTNPFRRKVAAQSSSVSNATGSLYSSLENKQPRIPPIDTGRNPSRIETTTDFFINLTNASLDLPLSTKTKTGKTVRIISPRSATSDSEHGMPHMFFSPPPIPLSSPPSNLQSPGSVKEDSPEDPFSAESDRGGGNTVDESTLQNTLRNSGNLQSTTWNVGAMPANPFKKSLASLGTEGRPGPPSQRVEGRSIDSRITRPHYDVEGFKKLLLTGEKTGNGPDVPVPPPVSFHTPAHVGDNGSNTDASSTSRQSISESVSGPAQESPRTSHESVPSDDERQQLVGSKSTDSERVKPVAPKHRHGKLVRTNAPQTVSFEATLSSSDFAMSAMAPVDRSMPGVTGRAVKPLPPLPSPLSTQSSMQNTADPTDNGKQDFFPESEQPPISDTAQNLIPPSPPLTRRHSQLRGKHFTNSIERSTPITEEATPETVLFSKSALNASSKAPPPPPPRRAGLVRDNSSSSISTGLSVVPTSDQSDPASVTARAAKPRPPIPPNRSPPVSSVNQPNQTPSIPGSPSMAPPLPPRRRGSSQSSYTPSRLSGQFNGRLRSDSSASSISHLAMTPAGPSGAENKDVLADLSALQREVDELRGKFKD